MSAESKWYVVHTYSGYENKVATNIEKIVENRKMQDEILEIKIPMETVTEVKDGKTVEVERKVFPGYVMVKLAVYFGDGNEPKMSDETWYLIRNTRGVTGFVGPESKPIPLTDEEVQKLGVEQRVVNMNYEVGDLVAVVDGPFEGFSGIVEEISTTKNMVRVLISMFGRETPVEFEFDQVENAVE
ncbi:MAG TPA: transcription termination/antitermination protein NusG [Oscillospiraceae bacterium]|nr:transcription termination/antitermination protein NusG [Oscillospiraceae bacterium]